MAKPIILLRFDGVLHDGDDSLGLDVIAGPPVEGAADFLDELLKWFGVCVYCSRSKDYFGISAMKGWLDLHGFPTGRLMFPKDEPEHVFKILRLKKNGALLVRP